MDLKQDFLNRNGLTTAKLLFGVHKLCMQQFGSHPICDIVKQTSIDITSKPNGIFKCWRESWASHNKKRNKDGRRVQLSYSPLQWGTLE